MQRAFVFRIVGPVTVALVATLTLLTADASGNLVQFIAMALLLLTLPVTAVAASVDGYLARTFPIELRAPITAIAGAMAAGAVAYTTLHCFFATAELMFFGLGGAICTGACSLLAHDFGWRRCFAPAEA
jgi:hypothetical protein